MHSPRRRSGAMLFLAPTPRLCNYGRGFMVFLDKRLGIGHRARVRQRARAHAKLRSGRRGMISLRMVGTEVSALGAAALSIPLRFVVERDRFDPSSPYPTPVVLVHGLFGDPTNFLLLRRYLATRGMRNAATPAARPTQRHGAARGAGGGRARVRDLGAPHPPGVAARGRGVPRLPGGHAPPRRGTPGARRRFLAAPPPVYV